MSYVLMARGDDSYSLSVRHSDVNEVISQLPDVEPNGPAGFVLKRGETVYMEIDITLVNEEFESQPALGYGGGQEQKGIVRSFSSMGWWPV